MPTKLNPQSWRDFSGANIQKVSSEIALPNGVPFSMNLDFDKILGEATTRLGTDLISAPSVGNCLGLFNHIDSTPASSKLFAAFGGTIYDAVSGLSSLSGLNSSAKCRFATFLNNTLMLNGVESRSYSASLGWISGGGVFDLANIPAGAQYPIEFKDRVYCAVVDKLHYTSTPAAGVVSWTGAGSGSLQAEQEDGGGKIQALNKVPGYLLIYKQRSLKRWNFDSSFPEDLVNIGTNSNESVVRARGNNYFFYNGNFYQTNGGYPQKFSRPVQMICDGIASSFYSEVNGWSDNDNIYWSIGDITVDFGRGFTETYTNVCLRYNIDSQQWCAYKYAHKFRFLHQYISGSDTFIAGGDSSGKVLQLNKGNTDYNGVPITYILQSPEFDFKIRRNKKSISEEIIVHSDGTQGAELQARLDYGEWSSIGSIKDIVSKVQIKSMTAYVFEFRIVQSSTGYQKKLRGLDFPNVEVLEN